MTIPIKSLFAESNRRNLEILKLENDRLVDIRLIKALLSESLPLAIHGKPFKSGKPKGAKSESTRYIEKLVAENPALKAKALYEIADKNIIGEMKLSAFIVAVSKSKNRK